MRTGSGRRRWSGGRGLLGFLTTRGLLDGRFLQGANPRGERWLTGKTPLLRLVDISPPESVDFVCIQETGNGQQESAT
jgi:hypothetical protein